jgi:hypothetical protein
VPVQTSLPKGAKKYFFEGNHEDWINQFADENPGIADILNIDRELQLTKNNWQIIPQGEHLEIGKMLFLHGDIWKGGGEYIAKKAVTEFESSVRFGHFHTLQTFTKTSRADASEVKTGMAIPCLCTRRPGYGKGAPNKWINGFLWGYIEKDGTFSDYVSVIVKDRFHANGTTYRG